VELSEANVPARQADVGDSLHLPRLAFAASFAQTLEIADASTARDGCDDGDIADDLDIHAEIVPLRALSP
jgi:hypothetical protein